SPSKSAVEDRRAPAAPDVDGEEEEEPDDVNEVPVPGGRLEAEMLLRREVAAHGADEADDQENRADQNVETVEPGRHEEGRAVDRILEGEGRMRILVGLHKREQDAEHDCKRQAVDE